MVKGWAIVLLAALVITAKAEDPTTPPPTQPLTPCQIAYQEWKEMFHAVLGDGCIDVSKTPVSEIKHTVDCARPSCVADVPEVYNVWASGLAECEEGNQWPMTEETVVAEFKDAVLSMCNDCAKGYAEMDALKATLDNEKCTPSANQVNCAESCRANVDKYIEMWEHLLGGGVCHQYLPGGCGIGTGMSEDQIYDKLVLLEPTIMVYRTLNTICNPTCNKAFDKWYGQWRTMEAASCVAVGKDELTGVTALTVFSTLKTTCTEECIIDLNKRVERTFYEVPAECRVNQPQEHFHQLRQAASEQCPDVRHASVGKVLSFNLIADVLVVLTIFFACVMALYCLVAAFVNFFIRRNRGLDILPDPFGWKRLLSVTNREAPIGMTSTASSSRSNPFKRAAPGEDEEKLIPDSR